MKAGIYLHIPFCKKACHYCNFHFSTSLSLREAMVNVLCREIYLQKDYLAGMPIGSVYFGGGTPSLLKATEIRHLMDIIGQYHAITVDAEITLETNPDDLSEAYLAALKALTPVNRLSIGIQSFSEEDLRWMNRAHSAAEALRCIRLAQETGFTNLTVDLIYGTPTTSDAQWAENIATVIELEVPHISCYCLTVEEGTALHHFVEKKKTMAPDETAAIRQFQYLMQQMKKNGYDHYEISNFARPGHYAVHNANYWKGVPYLGIGPSAHSYDGESRQWNIAHNPKYIQSLSNDVIPFEKEILTPDQRYNEYVMTALRTIWGCDTKVLSEMGHELDNYFSNKIQPFVLSGEVEKRGTVYMLTESGKLMADAIAAAAFR